MERGNLQGTTQKSYVSRSSAVAQRRSRKKTAGRCPLGGEKEKGKMVGTARVPVKERRRKTWGRIVKCHLVLEKLGRPEDNTGESAYRLFWGTEIHLNLHAKKASSKAWLEKGCRQGR